MGRARARDEVEIVKNLFVFGFIQCQEQREQEQFHWLHLDFKGYSVCLQLVGVLGLNFLDLLGGTLGESERLVALASLNRRH